MILLKKKFLDNFFNINFNDKKSIFTALIIGKLILLPIFYFLFISFDLRNISFFYLADMTKYLNFNNLLNIFNFGAWVPNAGFISLTFLINKITNFREVFNILIYALISLFLMSYTQTIFLNYLFKKKAFVKDSIKFLSIFLSIINFYILIYSFKPSTDVFGCYGIMVFIMGYMRYFKNEKESGSLKWFISLLIISLFRNLIIFLIPFILFSKLRKSLINDFLMLNSLKKFFVTSLITLLLIIGFFQIFGQYTSYIIQQVSWGIASLDFEGSNPFKIVNIISLINYLIKKIIYLISARETIGMTGDWLINEINGQIISKNIFISNILPGIFLFILNSIGLISIFRVLDKNFINAFLISLIPLIPMISFVTHHRYFLPYTIITTASIPFLFSNK